MKKVKAFTMIEVLITALLLGIGILTLHNAITRVKLINERTIQTMIANQLATEGTEILYQIRNTNFLRYESNKEIFVERCIMTGLLENGKIVDHNGTYTEECNGNRMKCYDPCLAKFKETNNINKCRLALDYQECIDNTSNYTGILNTGFYYIVTDNGLNSIEQCTGDYTEDDCLNNQNECCYKYRNEYAICLNSGVRVPCNSGHDLGDDKSTYGKFFRNIEGMGIYNMADNENTTGGKLLTINELSGANAQEFRFCSYLTRKGGENGAVEICSTMTNFIE